MLIAILGLMLCRVVKSHLNQKSVISSQYWFDMSSDNNNNSTQDDNKYHEKGFHFISFAYFFKADYHIVLFHILFSVFSLPVIKIKKINPTYLTTVAENHRSDTNNVKRLAYKKHKVSFLYMSHKFPILFILFYYCVYRQFR